jgi:protein arginine kinase activator
MRMNCEKCKNKKATLFYADEDGTKHALCASCGAIKGKLASFSAPPDPTDGESAYIPEPTLLELGAYNLIYAADECEVICKGCGAKVSDLRRLGGISCPECCFAFGNVIFPTLRAPEEAVKMPNACRERLDKHRAIAEAKAELRRAIETESFELAAALRDRIRRLEGRSV